MGFLSRRHYHTYDEMWDDAKSKIPIVKDFPIAGVNFRDISPLLLDSFLTYEVVEMLASKMNVKEKDVIVGVESRGFLVAGIMAQSHFIRDTSNGIVLVRKKGKLPPPVISYEYEKEYGSDILEMKKAEGSPRAFIVDDVLATGGTLRASYELCIKAGYDVQGIGVLIDLAYLHEPNFEIDGIPVQSVLSFNE